MTFYAHLFNRIGGSIGWRLAYQLGGRWFQFGRAQFLFFISGLQSEGKVPVAGLMSRSDRQKTKSLIGNFFVADQFMFNGNQR